MNLIRSLIGRRQFLMTFVSSTLTLVLGKFTKTFGLVFKMRVVRASEKPTVGERKSLKGIVVYYSGTGNTARVAGAIYRGIKSVIACDVAPIKKVKPEDMAKYDVMAIGGPNWFHRETANIKMFTHDMPRMNGKHCILFCTHGDQPTSQFWSMSRNILKKGMTIIGWNDWYGDGGQTLHCRLPDVEDGHPDEIDLMEAETFGRKMAEYSIRIYAGERDLIPSIPTPPGGLTNNWSPRVDALGNLNYFGIPDVNPEFDFTKCVYPRCTQCIENCPVRAIDFSVITSAGSIDSPLVVKGACASCGGICQRVCLYDAIIYRGEKTEHVIDMTKCTYPKCTLCADECPQDCIDLSVNPPVFHNWCEGCDLCWDICPEDAIDIPNMAEVHLKRGWWYRGSGIARSQVQTPTTGEGGEVAQASRQTARSLPPRFRPLIEEEEIGSIGQVMFLPNVPRLVLNKEEWPYHMGKVDDVLNVFKKNNYLVAQPLRTDALTQELETYSLPPGQVTENDMPRIKTVIQDVLDKISASIKSSVQAESKSDVRPIMSCILIFEDWLNRQGCIDHASNWYVETIDKYSNYIFLPYPGEVPFDIIFKMEGDMKKLYRLLVIVSTVDLIDFGNLTENKTVIVWESAPEPVPYLVPSGA